MKTGKGVRFLKKNKEAINLKNLLISDQILDYPRKHRSYLLFLDASTGTGDINGGLEAIIWQTDEEGEERLSMFIL